MNKFREIEQREGRSMSDILVDLFEKFGHVPNPQSVIARKLGVSQPTLSQWIKYLRLTRKIVLLKPGDLPKGGDESPES